MADHITDCLAAIDAALAEHADPEAHRLAAVDRAEAANAARHQAKRDRAARLVATWEAEPEHLAA